MVWVEMVEAGSVGYGGGNPTATIGGWWIPTGM